MVWCFDRNPAFSTQWSYQALKWLYTRVQVSGKFWCQSSGLAVLFYCTNFFGLKMLIVQISWVLLIAQKYWHQNFFTCNFWRTLKIYCNIPHMQLSTKKQASFHYSFFSFKHNAHSSFFLIHHRPISFSLTQHQPIFFDLDLILTRFSHLYRKQIIFFDLEMAYFYFWFTLTHLNILNQHKPIFTFWPSTNLSFFPTQTNLSPLRFQILSGVYFSLEIKCLEL